ncbi:flagellar hook assembly protein FlgD [Sutcliffiella deserti]|uniref:flagellar hook assembly protein FlgD n=1 Tax=Sutcliffiella deserti TaxID=2875501 RepID=UPI001CC0DAB7|nr:flagellar hook assembly protein FlgD [Sutcliffiella deserti]
MTNISSDLYIQNRSVETAKQNKVLGKDDFLKLLMAQLKNQDPMNPMEDREFIAQMASFSSLEQMTNLNTSMEGFIKTQEKQHAINLQQYIGSEITWQDTKFVGEEPVTEMKTGNVTSVAISGGTPKLVMSDGSEITMDQISRITSGQSNNVNDSTLLQASHLIGKKVSLVFKEKEYTNISVDSVVSKNGKTFITVSDPSLMDEKISLDAITKISQ